MYTPSVCTRPSALSPQHCSERVTRSARKITTQQATQPHERSIIASPELICSGAFGRKLPMVVGDVPCSVIWGQYLFSPQHFMPSVGGSRTAQEHRTLTAIFTAFFVRAFPRSTIVWSPFTPHCRALFQSPLPVSVGFRCQYVFCNLNMQI